MNITTQQLEKRGYKPTEWESISGDTLRMRFWKKQLRDLPEVVIIFDEICEPTDIDASDEKRFNTPNLDFVGFKVNNEYVELNIDTEDELLHLEGFLDEV